MDQMVRGHEHSFLFAPAGLSRDAPYAYAQVVLRIATHKRPEISRYGYEQSRVRVKAAPPVNPHWPPERCAEWGAENAGSQRSLSQTSQ